MADDLIECERRHSIKVATMGNLVLLFVQVDGEPASISLLDAETARTIGDELERAAQATGATPLGNSPEVCERSYIHAFREDVQERNRRLLDPPDVIDLDSRRKGA